MKILAFHNHHCKSPSHAPNLFPVLLLKTEAGKLQKMEGIKKKKLRYLSNLFFRQRALDVGTVVRTERHQGRQAGRCLGAYTLVGMIQH